MPAAAELTRPVLRYYGGKWRLAPWVIANLPPHRMYVEPYCGAASVLLRKPRAKVEVLNDRDREIVGFFRVLRERPRELIRAIRHTPFSRVEFELSYHRDWTNELEAARRLYVRCWQALHAGLRPTRSGWRRSKDPDRRTTEAAQFTAVDHLWAVVERLRGVQLECDDGLQVLRRYDRPETLFYCDPPYTMASRYDNAKHGYGHEMSTAEHAMLLAAVRNCRGMVVLSGYRSHQYDEALEGWERVERESQTFAGKTATECLWLSPAAVRARG